LEVKRYGKSYDEYIKPNLLYFTEDLNALARELNVNRVVPKGLYIMAIYGGERKKEMKVYAGIALHEYSYDGARFKFRLWRVEDLLVVPSDLLKKYNIKIFNVVYEGEINPFKLRRLVPVILSGNGAVSLKSFLQKALELNIDIIPHRDTVDEVKILIDEVEQPNNVTPLDIDKHYVVYRCDRAFTAFAFKPQEPNTIIESHVAYAECEKESIAYYYAASLNYLAYKVIQSGRSFIRHQFARPLLAACIAGLTWKDIDEATKSRVVELSKMLHEKAPDKEYSNQKVALRDIAMRFPEFRELEKVLDSKVDKERLEDALKIVSGKGIEEEE
jgi:hypothetical protein